MSKQELRKAVEGDVVWLIMRNGLLRRCVVEKVEKKGGYSDAYLLLIPFDASGKQKPRRREHAWNPSATGPGLGMYWEFREAMERAEGRAQADKNDALKTYQRKGLRLRAVQNDIQAWCDSACTDRPTENTK